jgi:hypothetical protein
VKSKAEIDKMFAAHETEQTLHIARTTTPEQRLQWVHDMLILLWENGFYTPKPYDIPPGFREE